MKKIVSIVMLLLIFSSNFFYYSFADEPKFAEILKISEDSKISEDLEIWKDNGLDSSVASLSQNDDNLSSWAESTALGSSEVSPVFSGVSREGYNSDSSQAQNDGEVKMQDNSEELATQEQPNLIISEVFFGWSNEWIEIYNAWEDFLWDLTFAGVYNGWWTRSFLDVKIGNWESKIFGNSTAIAILWDIPFLIPDKKFQIWDSSEFEIQLLFSGEVLDEFFGDAGQLDKNISFHKIIETREIFATTLDYSKNVDDNYLANPWFVFFQEIESDEPDPEEPQDPTLTWNTIQVPDLKITEIYFDGNDNWFEITNLWDNNFSWDLILNWNLNFTISTQIQAWISKVFANSLDMFQTWKNIEIIENNISFANEEIDLDLIWSGQILDTFFVHESRVDFLQEYETSFEKVWNWSDWTTTYVWFNDRRYNINRWIAANPTKYFTAWENIKDVTQNRNWSEIYTGNDYDLPIDCDDFWNDYTAKISEIYFWNDIYPSYVELKIDDDISDYKQILLSGSAVSNPVYFNTRWIKKNTFVLLTNSDVWYNEWRESKINNDFSLHASWWLIVYGVDSYWEDVLDIVYITKSNTGNSIYMGSEILDCAGVFDYEDKFSPWITLWQSQFIQITPDPIVKYVSLWWWGSCAGEEKPRFDSSTFEASEIQISAIKYYEDRQILKLKNRTKDDIDLHDYYLQFLDWTNENIQWNTLFAKSTMSFVWNYWLAKNQDFCVNLMKNWEVIDRYCRNSLTKASVQDEENIKNQLKFWEDLNEENISDDEDIEEKEEDDEQKNKTNDENIFQTNVIKIVDIDYDPPGADWNNESVTLLLLSGDFVDLSGYNFYYTKDGKTQKTKAQINGILSHGNKQTFKWWFAFPNSTTDKNSVTVNLIWPDKKVVDTYIYNPNKITQIPAGEYEVISVIDWDTIKIEYEWQEFTIRFAGTDAPESSALRCGKVECFGPESKEYLTSLLEWKKIYFEPESIDGYDRFVWYIFLDWENINEKMIKEWYAREYSYKNQKYKYQSDFKSAQNFAQSNNLGLWWNQCKWARFCPVDETNKQYNFVLNIENIVYDPQWDDNGKEEIWIKMIDGITTEFGTDFYLLVNDTKKSLKKYGAIAPWETVKLMWTFWFPNSKLTTVSLLYNWEILDTYMYNPKLDKLVDTGSTLSTWDDLLAKISQFSILSILPNPFGADGANEEIELFCKSELENLNLSDWFYLQVWTTKKYLKWEISTNEGVNLKWAFTFPNKWACVELGYKWFIFDKFCYSQPDEWQKFFVSNGVIESISTLDLSILKNSKLQNMGNKVCLTYAGQTFNCKNMPYSKLSTKRVNENKMYKSFFKNFETYMKQNWKIMYYDSEIKNYFELLDEIQDVISQWWTSLAIDWSKFAISDFEKMYEAKYKKTASKTLWDAIKFLLPKEIVDKYKQLESEYLEILRQ